jgi:hypothetical protein
MDLNTTLDENGTIDYTSVEYTLNKFFETDFPRYYQIIEEAVLAGHKIGKVIPNSKEITTAIERIIALGNIGRLRHPDYMAQAEMAIFGTLLEVMGNSVDLLQSGLGSYIKDRANLVNKLPVDYKELSDSIRNMMGDITYAIFTAPEGEYFLLPDCTSATQRFQLEEDSIIDGVTFINPARPVGLVIMPINSKIILTAIAAKLLPGNSHGIYPICHELIHSYNKTLYENAYNGIACENRKYLEEFLKSISPL